jgi:ABC-2 type transport system ATP-binding protein
MNEAADRPFSGYSSGMKQRIAIARALLHDPPILLMDEPTRSLDPASAMSLRQFIAEELSGRDRKTILLATHHLREAEALSHRVAILVSGRVRRLGTVAEVRLAGIRGRTYRLEVEPSPQRLHGPFELVSDRTDDGVRKLTVALDEHQALNDLLRAALDSGFVLRACDRLEPDLEEAFTRVLEDGAAEEAVR